jgi:C4-dicarboxylate-specific signal transduction histidine kinase
MTLHGPGANFTVAQIQSLVTLNRALMIQHLLRGIAHDIRNNLQVVALGSSLGDDAGTPAISLRVERSLDAMVVSLDRLSRLGKHPADEPPGTDLGEALATVGELAELQRNLPTLRLKIEQPAAPVMVGIQRDELLQVLLNLVANAKEASARPTDSVEVSATMPMDGRVALSIDDSGGGIPSDVGGPFASTKDPYHHGGLGLFVSRVLVERVGGELSWQPRPEGGTRVRVVLPVSGRG